MDVPAERAELFERWKLAHAEYRAEVALGWDRQKHFVTLSAVLTMVGIFARYGGLRVLVPAVVFGLAALIAIAGVLVVRIAHTRAQLAARACDLLETQLDGRPAVHELESLGETLIPLVLIAALDVALAVTW